MFRSISHLLITLILVFAAAICTRSQTTPNCPTVTVNGPAGNVDADPFTFTATINGKADGKIEYKWTVSKGQIIDGQGTKEITVVDTDREGAITGTVELAGLPSGCVAIASETTGPNESVPAILIDEVEPSISKVSEQTLRAAAEEQKNNPNLYIIAYTDNNVSQFDVREGIKKLSEFLIKEMKLTSDDFEIEVVTDAEQNRTKFYRIPPGASNPTP